MELWKCFLGGSGRRFEPWREVRPMFDAEGAHITDGRREPRQSLQRRNGVEQVAEVFAVADVDLDAALDGQKPIAMQRRSGIRVSLGYTLGMVCTGIGHRKIEGDGKHQSTGSAKTSATVYAVTSPVVITRISASRGQTIPMTSYGTPIGPNRRTWPIRCVGAGAAGPGGGEMWFMRALPSGYLI